MSTPKEQAQELIKRLPETATWDEIRYQLYVAARVARGIEDMEAGRVVSQEEVEKKFCRD